MGSQRERREESGGRKAPSSRAPREPARKPSAVEAAITILGLRALTEKKLREKLAARYEEAEVEAAMERLRELRLVDDAAWASRFAAERFARAGKGRHRIRAELQARGIDGQSAEAALASLPAGDEERERAAVVLESMRRRMTVAGPRGSAVADAAEGTEPDSAEGLPAGAGADAAARRNRLFRRMIARGWPADLVRDLLEAS